MKLKNMYNCSGLISYDNYFYVINNMLLERNMPCKNFEYMIWSQDIYLNENTIDYKQTLPLGEYPSRGVVNCILQPPADT